MSVRPCLTCGRLTTGSYCARHVADASSATRQTPGRTTAGAKAFRAQVLAAAGHRCQAVLDGARCPVTGARHLQAHHVQPLRSGGEDAPHNGVALCRCHHELAEALGASKPTGGRTA